MSSSYDPGGTADAVSVPSTSWRDILRRSFMYSDMGFDDLGNRSFKMVIKTQTLKDLQDLHTALVGNAWVPIPPLPKGQTHNG